MNARLRIGAVLVPLVALCGCLGRVDTVASAVDATGWAPGRSVSLTYRAEDTTAYYRMELVVRYDGRLDDAELPLRIEAVGPDSMHTCEYVTFFVPQRSVRLRELQLPYRDSVRWPHTGSYRLSIEPLRLLRGVAGIGFRIDRIPTEWEKTN